MEQTIQQFGLTKEDIILKDGTFYVPISKLAEALKVKMQSVHALLKKHHEDFEGFRRELTPFKTKGGVQKGYLLEEEDIYVLCMLMTRSSAAKHFRRVLAKHLKALRKREFIHISFYEDKAKELRELKAAQILLLAGISTHKKKFILENESYTRLGSFILLPCS